MLNNLLNRFGPNAVMIGASVIAAVTLIICVLLLSGSKNSGRGQQYEPLNSQSASFFSSDVSSANVSEKDSSSDTESDTSSKEAVSSNDEVSSGENVSSGAEELPSRSGNWSRTKVKKENASSLSISNSTSSGFSFTLTSKKGSQSAKLSGNAKYSSAGTAKCSINGSTLIFSFQEDYVTLSHEGSEENLGCSNGITHDGIFVKGTPEYVDNLSNTSYSADIRKSTMCISALKGCMTGNDYQKMNSIMENGTQIINQNSELTYDKDGNPINVDSQMKGVKYSFSLQGAGEHAFLICTNGGKVYAGLVIEGEMRYYTNDPTYASAPPKSFESIAKNYGVKIKNMSK